MKKHHVTFVLLTLFFTGLLLLWGADYLDLKTNSEKARQAVFVLPELADLSEYDIEKIEIQQGKEKLVFDRKGRQRWQMVEPINTSADAALIESTLRSLKELRKSRDSGEIKGTAATFGLEPPRASVTLFGKDASKPIATLEIGTPIEGYKDQVYVRARDHDGGYRSFEQVDARMLSAIGKPAIAWRDKSLFNSPTFLVTELEVSGPGRELTAKRESRGVWHISRPVNAPADEEKIEGVLAELTSLRVAEGEKGFVADNVQDLSKYGLDKPEMTIQLTTAWGGGEIQKIYVGKPVPDKKDLVYAMQDPQDDVVMINGKEIRDLAKGRNSLRSKRISILNPTRAVFIELHASQRNYRLSRSSSGWTLLGEKPEKADEATVNKMLTTLAGAQTSDFFEPKAIAKPGLDPPRTVLKVWEAESSDNLPSKPETAPPAGEPILTLEIGYYEPVMKALFVRIPGDQTILALTKDVADALPKNALAFRDRSVLSLNPVEIAKLSITRTGEETYELEAPAGRSKSTRWRMTAPIESPADQEEATKMVLILANLHAEEFVTDQPGDRKTFGLDKPTLTATWTLEPQKGAEGSAKEKPQASSGTLRVGKRVPNSESSYAEIIGQPMVFTLGPDVLQPFKEELRDHLVVAIPPERVLRLVLRWPDRAISFVPKTNESGTPTGWQPEAGPDAAAGFDVPRLNALIKSLADLHTPKFVQYRGILPKATGLTTPQLAIEIQVLGTKNPHVLRLGQRSQEGPLYATVDSGDAGAVFLLPGPSWAELARSPKKLDPAATKDAAKKKDEPSKK